MLKTARGREAETPERKFLDYAGPCLDSREARGDVRPEHSTEVRRLIDEEAENPRRSLLRYVFREAYNGMRRSARKLGTGVWATEAIRDYFINEHNKHVDNARGRVPESLLDRCRVSVGEVAEDRGETAVVNFPGKTEEVLKKKGSDLHKGDRVAVHFRQIVDILD